MEVPLKLAAQEAKHGISQAKRDRVLRTLVRNLFDFNQKVSDARWEQQTPIRHL